MRRLGALGCAGLATLVLVASACDDPIVVDAGRACATSAEGGRDHCFELGGADLVEGDCVEVRLATESARVLSARQVDCP